MKKIPIFQVDAFTKTPFSGNPAAVCILEEEKSADWMQKVAMEMNLSETAFVEPLPEGEYSLRWFTPTVEVDLCGHATIATAHVLLTEGYHKSGHEAIKFHTKSGALGAEKHGETIKLDFPLEKESEEKESQPLLKALGIDSNSVNYVGKGRYDHLVEVASPKSVQEVNPDLKALEKVTQRGAIVTSQSSDEAYDFISRFFAPAAGVDEDPVTGSAHCLLAPYWGQKLEKNALWGYQASQRGGAVGVEVEYSRERVHLYGHSITVFKGHFVN